MTAVAEWPLPFREIVVAGTVLVGAIARNEVLTRNVFDAHLRKVHMSIEPGKSSECEHEHSGTARRADR